MMPLGILWATVLNPRLSVWARVASLVPAAAAVCGWGMAFCFAASVFMGGKSYRGDEALPAYQLYLKGRTFAVSPAVWQFQRWCDGHMVLFGVMALALLLTFASAGALAVAGAGWPFGSS